MHFYRQLFYNDAMFQEELHNLTVRRVPSREGFSPECLLPMQMECVDLLPSKLMGTVWYAIKA